MSPGCVTLPPPTSSIVQLEEVCGQGQTRAQYTVIFDSIESIPFLCFSLLVAVTVGASVISLTAFT
jgi:hypothetical protein